MSNFDDRNVRALCHLLQRCRGAAYILILASLTLNVIDFGQDLVFPLDM
jgi:hypothetical protein